MEISCHGSSYIQQKIITCYLDVGINPAQAGEFTLRAYLNRKMDLSQAEAVADIIAAESASAHQIAMQQMRGGFSKKMENLRQELIQELLDKKYMVILVIRDFEQDMWNN